VIRHVVLMKFIDNAAAPEAKVRLDALLEAIPELLTLDVALDAVGGETSYDLCLTSTHDDVDGLREYQEHPVHQELLQWLRPRLASRAVVDSEH
jgi:hypothetical protein